ncbi:MAG TPA: hypothetical protein VKR30_07425 [Candidatus Limnocylindrales bacterium]|nr:hypothetical protein [Candidatus Limnocylindrales bacterium]
MGDLCRIEDAPAGRRRPTGDPAATPVAHVLDQLEALGFHRIGERTIVLPDGGRRFEWTWADETGETYVAVVPMRLLPALMACYTAFADWAWLQTNYPRGEVIDRPDYVARYVDTTVAGTVAAHRAEIARLRQVHGAPRRVQSMADSLRLDAEYRTRHGGVTLRRLTFRIMTPAFAAAGLAIICGLLLLLGR